MSCAHENSSPGDSLQRAAAITMMMLTIVLELDYHTFKRHTTTDTPVKMMVRMETAAKPFNTRANKSLPEELRSQDGGYCSPRTK